MVLSRRLQVALAAFTALAVVAGAASVSAAATPAATSVAVPGFVCAKTDKANGGFVIDCDPAPFVPSPTTSPTASPTVAPTATPTPSPTVTTPPPAGFPTATSVGAPASPDWTPTARGTWTITTPGVYSNYRITGSINIRTTGVVLRRVEVIGGTVNNVASGRCYGFTIEDSTVRNSTAGTGAVGPGGYTARRVALIGVGEGFRIGGRGDAGCGPVLIEDSYVKLAKPSTVSCGDWHGDAIQGYDAPTAVIRNTTLDARDNAGCGTAGVFYGDAEDNGNQPLVVRRLLVFGGVAYRPDTPHDTEGLRIVDGTTRDLLGGSFTCQRATRWVDNAVSDAAGNVVRPITC